MMILPFTKPKLTVAGEPLKAQPLTLEQTIELFLLIAPYVSLVERRLPQLKTALENTDGNRPRMLQSFFAALAQDIKPQDFTKAFAILLQKPPEWFANVKAAELVQALPLLDDINDFAGMFETVKALGLTVKYGQ